MRLFAMSVFLLVLLVGGCTPKITTKDKALSHFKMGQSYLANKNYTQALDELLKAEKLSPRDASIQSHLAEAYFGKRAFALSETHYKKSLELNPGDPNVENNLAALYLAMQRWEDAAMLFRKVADNLLFSHRVRALVGMGIAYQRNGDYIKSILSFDEALKASPNSPSIMTLEAQSYMLMGKHDLARKRLVRVVGMMPENSNARMMLGECLLYLDDNDAAAEQFREVANREDGTARGNKAREYLSMLQDQS